MNYCLSLLLPIVAINLVINNQISTIIAIIAIMFRLNDCLFTIHARLHALDSLPEIHSQACITAIGLKISAQMLCRCTFWLTPWHPWQVCEAPGKRQRSSTTCYWLTLILGRHLLKPLHCWKNQLELA